MRPVYLLSALALFTLPAHAQDLYTITAQNRTVTAWTNCQVKGCQEQNNTASAPDNGSWMANVEATSPPSHAHATAAQTSNITGTSFTGGVSANSWSGGGGAGASSSSQAMITFVPTERLRFAFAGYGFAPFIGQNGASYSLSNVFSGTASNITPLYATGLLEPGVSYTFRAGISTGGLGEGRGGNYTLELAPADPPAEIIGGPITRIANCHRYFQLAPSSWFAAEAGAQELNGHLVTINDAAEQTWLQSTFASTGPANKWTGMRTLASNTPFRWASGQTPAYTRWAPGQPNYDAPPPFGHFGYYGASGMWFNGNTNVVAGGIVEFEGCRCDWDFDGERTSTDFFRFLTDFFGAGADFNCSGGTTSADFFEFLSCFLAEGC